MRYLMLSTLACAAISTGGSAFAVSVSPTDYTMRNGSTGLFTYFDDTYNGSGNTTSPGAILSGGLGDLTDGVIATEDWYAAEQAGSGPYVGWPQSGRVGRVSDPTITFNFAETLAFNSVTVFFADSDGYGSVDGPSAVAVNGQYFEVADPVTDGVPSSVILDITGQVTDQLTVQLFHNNSWKWMFVSEIQFDAGALSAVPAPAGGGLLVAALAALAAFRSRRIARKNA